MQTIWTVQQKTKPNPLVYTKLQASSSTTHFLITSIFLPSVSVLEIRALINLSIVLRGLLEVNDESSQLSPSV